MKLTVEINMDGVAFEDDVDELSRILYSVSEAVYMGEGSIEAGGSLIDSNGNSCGSWKVEE